MFSPKDRRAWGAMLPLVLPIITLTLVADLWTKAWAAEQLSETPITITDWFTLTYAENPGIAFSLPLGGPLLVLINAVLLIGFLVMAPRLVNCSKFSGKLALGLVLGGGLGNLIDRIQLGIVRDFIDIGPWPIFNVADAALTFGLLILIHHFYFPSHE